MKSRETYVKLFIVVFCALFLYFTAPYSLASPEPRVIDPRYSVPITVFPGQRFNVTLSSPGVITGAWIKAPGINYTLRLVGSASTGDAFTLVFEVPIQAEPNLYDLYLNVSGEFVAEPRSVWLLKREPDKLFIAHLSDLHEEVVIGGVRSTVYVESAFNLVNTLQIDLVAITGDCVDVGSDINAFKTLYELANRIRKPTFFVPGNHDHSQTDARSFSEQYYGRYVGPANWYRVVGSFLIASLDTGIAGYADMQQLEWLDKITEVNRDKVKIILMHHPIFQYNLFASIDGSWRELDKLSGYIYSSWAGRAEELQRFLRIVEERGVSLVLSGHVHGDGLVVYNNKTWFITTTTTGGSADWRGFKIVSIDARGCVEAIGRTGRNPLSEPSSFTLDGTVFRVLYDASHEAATVLAKLDPRLGLPLKEIEALLYLNGSIPLYSYSLFGDKTLVKEFSSKAYTPWHLAYLTLSVQPGTSLVTVASYADSERPSVSVTLYTPRRPVAQQDRVTLYLRASDSGWGIWRVLVKYSTDSESGELEAREVGAGSYQAELPALNATTLRVEAIAWDLAGNIDRTYEEINYIQPEKQEEAPAAPPEQPPAEEPEQGAPEREGALVFPSVELMAAVVVVVAALAVGILFIKRKRS